MTESNVIVFALLVFSTIACFVFLLYRNKSYSGDTVSQTLCSMRVEDPKLTELREQAYAKMRDVGRRHILEGGVFTLDNKVLKC